jgi:predicted porin
VTPSLFFSTLENFSMKKTLIALAAVAVSSAAFAQVTISGNVDARYQSAKTSTAAATKGFLISDAQLHFAATEDLGGGTTATARFTIDGADSDGLTDAPIAGDGVFLSFANAQLGSVTFSSLDASDYLPNDLVTDQLGAGGVSPYNGSVQDRVSYASPMIAGFRFTATMQEGAIGTGKSATNTSEVYELDYTAGPLTANVGMLSTDKNVNTALDGYSRFRVGYNFGVAAVTYGQINAKNANAVKDKITAWSVSVPMGAITLGYAYATSKSGTAAKQDGSAFSASYALSKRTSLHAEQVNYETATFSSAKRTRITARHAF